MLSHTGPVDEVVKFFSGFGTPIINYNNGSMVVTSGFPMVNGGSMVVNSG